MEKSPFSGVQATYSERYDNFDEAFLQRFKGQNDIWLVLGNRGVTNYYRERFSKNEFTNLVAECFCSSTTSLIHLGVKVKSLYNLKILLFM